MMRRNRARGSSSAVSSSGTPMRILPARLLCRFEVVANFQGDTLNRVGGARQPHNTLEDNHGAFEGTGFSIEDDHLLLETRSR